MLHFVILKKPKQKIVILTAKEKKKKFHKDAYVVRFSVSFRFVFVCF